ncbi:hypothetical protein DL237_08930 [Pseudooceanicola sediminis]|uniref:2Fe-2S ferredoxin-type domain-containing protein n=1 Tax=Pseudooceanicola sediminis TaxID=2211117 RepID=A0A399J4A4_9RHOB|nr:2Fe-2S iron-sulfur cluster-binding protein [Pseudooceanicola sediminis]KAA2316346.1 2Fe-2S iron-sulfur cluster binding domain-containing protein [Puniceibacterium sp. HSS470]RII39259.1 hypothetical protein DL237_08930 [Pseudooceanicola sediminis]|tara:strand:+ start:9630 stop:9953 length:324 start_codon:yes stop_codon:yes gene_type:complete
MPRIIFRNAQGQDTPVEAAMGDSLMLTAVSNGLAEIVGECGGSAMCATCHVYVSPEHADVIPTRKPIETEMLESAAAEVTQNSRLSCQIVVTPEMDGMVVLLPDRQY